MIELGTIKIGLELGKKEPSRKYVYVECPICQERRWSRFNYHYNNYPNVRCNSCLISRGSNHAIWKGGKHLVNGYVRLRLIDGDPYFVMADRNNYLFDHRYIMAKHLGRVLEPWELVHHKNGIKDDNRLDNLEVVTHLQNLSASIRVRHKTNLPNLQEIQQRPAIKEVNDGTVAEANESRIWRARQTRSW